MNYGKPPIDLGHVEVDFKEVMYYLYMPVKMPGQVAYIFEPRLRPISGLLNRIAKDLTSEQWKDSYVYVTIKRMYVGEGISPNRPGWHADGFGSDDLNYIWMDALPTEFSIGEFDITDDHLISLREFEEQAPNNKTVNYPLQHLLKLDPYVVHRVARATDQIMRTFIKVSVSRHKYNLKDNSINHELDYNWEMHDRDKVRNDPNFAQGDTYESN